MSEFARTTIAMHDMAMVKHGLRANAMDCGIAADVDPGTDQALAASAEQQAPRRLIFDGAYARIEA